MTSNSLDRVKKYQSIRKEKGIAISNSLRTPDLNGEVGYLKVINIKVPWSGSYSKNVILGRGIAGKRVFLKQAAKNLKLEIGLLLRSEMRKKRIRFVEDKIWLDIFVQKPNAGAGDAINVLDLVADGISEGIGVDDRWFCIKSLDWAVIKKDPMIYIEIGQADDIPKRICSYCGIIRKLEEDFNINKSDIRGHSRICKMCIKTNRKVE